jgi:hypothetical protein
MFTSDKSFEVAVIARREYNTVVGREKEASSIAITTVFGTCMLPVQK